MQGVLGSRIAHVRWRLGVYKVRGALIDDKIASRTSARVEVVPEKSYGLVAIDDVVSMLALRLPDESCKSSAGCFVSICLRSRRLDASELPCFLQAHGPHLVRQLPAEADGATAGATLADALSTPIYREQR